jgi:gamma-butyrobetaine dioxygenase
MNQLTQIQQIEDLYKKWGSDAYTELVSQTAHGVQCAVLAEQSGATSALVIATLLHDIGHLADLEDHSGEYVLDEDLEHEASGARLLAKMFPPAVTAPVALHVAAKRYLCAVEPGYLGTLSDVSTHTLHLQGGPMDDGEASRFERLPHALDAVDLRRWDDLGKDPMQDREPFGVFCELLKRHSAAL